MDLSRSWEILSSHLTCLSSLADHSIGTRYQPLVVWGAGVKDKVKRKAAQHGSARPVGFFEAGDPHHFWGPEIWSQPNSHLSLLTWPRPVAYSERSWNPMAFLVWGLVVLVQAPHNWTSGKWTIKGLPGTPLGNSRAALLVCFLPQSWGRIEFCACQRAQHWEWTAWIAWPCRAISRSRMLSFFLLVTGSGGTPQVTVCPCLD